MGVFEDVVGAARDAADVVSKKTVDIVELSKLRLAAADVQNKIDREFKELGLAVYSGNKEEKDVADVVTEKTASLDALHAQLDDLSEKIGGLRHIRRCAACGCKNPEDAAFCLKCGAKL